MFFSFLPQEREREKTVGRVGPGLGQNEGHEDASWVQLGADEAT